MRYATQFLVTVLISLAAACAPGERLPPKEGALDHSILRHTFIDEGGLVTLAVNADATRRREKSDYVPVGLAIANNGLGRLTVNRESVTLVDDQGQRYPMATVHEVRSLGSRTVVDLRASVTFEDIFSRRMLGRSRVPSVFFPIQVSEPGFARRGVVAESIELARNAWMLDVVYFPHPEGELVGRRYEVWLETPELPHPVFVRFAVE